MEAKGLAVQFSPQMLDSAVDSEGKALYHWCKSLNKNDFSNVHYF